MPGDFSELLTLNYYPFGAAPIPPTFWWLPSSQCASHFPPILGTEQQDIIQFQSVGRATPISPPLFPIPDVIYCYKNVGGREGKGGVTEEEATPIWRRGGRGRRKKEGVSNVQNNTLWRLLLLRCRSVGWNEMKMGIFFQPAKRGREVASLRDGGSRYHFSRSPPRGAKQKYPIPSSYPFPREKKLSARGHPRPVNENEEDDTRHKGTWHMRCH